MHCSLCNAPNHNKRTCPLAATPSEIRIAKDLSAILGPPKKKKVVKPLEGLYGCKNIFKEPRVVKKKKKVAKPLEGLHGCKNIFKEPSDSVAWAYNPAMWEKENKVAA
jgi:hypothetical protein